MIVLKFGGSSVADPERIEQVIAQVAGSLNRGGRACVFSAFGGVTDLLLEMSGRAARGDRTYLDYLESLKIRHRRAIVSLVARAEREALDLAVEEILVNLSEVLHGVFLVKELTPRTSDFLMSFGERLSARIIAAAMRSRGINGEYLDARRLIKTDDCFGNARVDLKTTYAEIAAYFVAHPSFQVVTGFIGSTANDETTTLGRGGSDYTAALIGAALGVRSVEIWTDVDGVLSADPRKVTDAFPLPRLSFEEAMELSYFGAKVIYAPTMAPAMAAGIPLLIRNTFNPAAPGTLIGHSEKLETIAGVSSMDRVALLTLKGSGLIGVPGISKRLFGELANLKINVILITQSSSEHAICVALLPESASPARQGVEREFANELALGLVDPVTIEEDLSIIAVVGEKMRHQPGVAGRVFGLLGRRDINVIAIAQGSSERNISLMVKRADQAPALNAIHQSFFSAENTIHLYLAGTGLIGSTLLGQIIASREKLAAELGCRIQLAGIINSRRMCVAPELAPENWHEVMAVKGRTADFGSFTEIILDRCRPRSVFVDCTASEVPVAGYDGLLQKDVAVVAANKLGLAGDLDQYLTLRGHGRKARGRFLFESTVGAGLPVLATLANLVRSGDEILAIEAVLSGTLSYIFNHLDESNSLSAVVAAARSAGLTEPDPREDLSGRDVARKLLILARESGSRLARVEAVSLVPDGLAELTSVADFMAALPDLDDSFGGQLRHAQANNKRLRYLAAFTEGRCRVGLEAVGPDHPAYHLTGTENLVSFRTARYDRTPLVVRGPGAGAEVTAAGVLADILRASGFLV